MAKASRRGSKPAAAEPHLERVMGPWLLLLCIVVDILGPGSYALTCQVANQVGGVRWLPDGVPAIVDRRGARIRVLLHGDQVRDDKGRGLDGNHLPPWVPDRRSGDGVEGGLFESWFTVVHG